MATSMRTSLRCLCKNFRNLSLGNLKTALPSQTLGSGSIFTLQCRFKHQDPYVKLGKIQPLIKREQAVILDEVQNKKVIDRVSEELMRGDLGRLFAVVHVRGLQRKVTTEDLVVVQGYFPPTIGDRIRLEKVLLVGSKDFTLMGKPLLSRTMVSVEATVIEKTLTHSKPFLTYRARKNNRKFKLRKGEQTVLVINKIAVNPMGLAEDNSDIISVG